MNEILLGLVSLVGVASGAYVSFRMLSVNRSATMATTIGSLAESLRKLSDEAEEERGKRREENAAKDKIISDMQKENEAKDKIIADMQKQIDGLIKTNRAIKKALSNGNGNGAK